MSFKCLTSLLAFQFCRQLPQKCQFHCLSSVRAAVSLTKYVDHRSASSSVPRPTWFNSAGVKGSGHSRRGLWLRTMSSQSHTEETGKGAQSLTLYLAAREVRVPLVWLRDHCRCPVCYNEDTFQKNALAYSLDNLAVLESSTEGDDLSVRWQDGHLSKFSLRWINDNFYSPGRHQDRILWDGPCIEGLQLPVTPLHVHMNSEDGVKNTLLNIIIYGFCIVDGVPATEEATEEVARRISFLQETVFGRISTMWAGELTHTDTAYTNLPLGPHNDTTYLSTPAGIQVFHCFHHDGEGGKTLLVDGFHAAEKLRKSSPGFFRTLETTKIPHEFIDGSHYHLYSVGPVLSTDPLTGDLTCIRYNPYDRAPLRTLSPKAMEEFYLSYDALSSIIESRNSKFWVKLQPGMVLLVDNWRVMHGRSAFTGKRALCSCYLPRDDWTSHARVLGLL